MLSGKTMYYNAIKTDAFKADTCVSLANGSATTSTALGRIFIFCHIKNPIIVTLQIFCVIFCLAKHKAFVKFPALKSSNVIMRISKLPCLRRPRQMKSILTMALTRTKLIKRKCHRPVLKTVRQKESLFLSKRPLVQQSLRLLKSIISKIRKLF